MHEQLLSTIKCDIDMVSAIQFLVCLDYYKMYMAFELRLTIRIKLKAVNLNSDNYSGEYSS